jgi:serine/threonine protein kinase
MHPADESFELREIWPAGTLIKGDFVIEKRLGGGGFGTVYLARNRFLGTTNVIKRLHEQYASDQEFVRKFVNEGRVMRRLRGCPHIVEIEQVTQTEDRHLILVMEYVPGGDLADLMESRVLSVYEVIEFARQIAVGLQVAHQAGLVHRDIKPQNVLVGRDSEGKPQLKLIDFGIAADQHSNHQTSVMRGGSIGYAALEQWEKAGKDLDGRTDLYSLGATMYRMLTGQMPYPGVADIGPWIERIKNGPPQPVWELRAEVPVELSQLIRDLLAVRPEERPADAGVVVARLEAMELSKTPPQAPVRVVVRDAPTPVPTRLEAPSKERVTLLADPIEAWTPQPVLALVSDSGEKRSNLALVRTWRAVVLLSNEKWRTWVIMAGVAGVLIASFGAWQYFVSARGKINPNPPTADSTRTNPKDGLKYVWIPPGHFTMGCSADDTECSADGEPAHDVQVTKGFWLRRRMRKSEARIRVISRATNCQWSR